MVGTYLVAKDKPTKTEILASRSLPRISFHMEDMMYAIPYAKTPSPNGLTECILSEAMKADVPTMKAKHIMYHFRAFRKTSDICAS